MFYKSETELKEKQTSESNSIRLTAKMLKVNRLEEINTRYNSNRLDQMSFYQCKEKVDTVREKPNDLDPGSEKNEAEEKMRSHLGLREITCMKKKKPPVSTEKVTQTHQSTYDQEKVHKLNKENTVKANEPQIQRNSPTVTQESRDKVGFLTWENPKESKKTPAGKDFSKARMVSRPGEGVTTGEDRENTVKKNGVPDHVTGSCESPVTREEKNVLTSGEEEDACGEETGRAGPAASYDAKEEAQVERDPRQKKKLNQRHNSSEKYPSAALMEETNPIRPLSQNDEQAGPADHSNNSKRHVNDEELLSDDNKKSKVDAARAGAKHKSQVVSELKQAWSSTQDKPQESDAIRTENGNKTQSTTKENYFVTLFDNPTPPAPFDHKIVITKKETINNFYSVSRTEILGGGRFGQVHKCEEKASGLKLAAKIIKTRGVKEK
uniref:Protein kinase domain-containing protein n=1 Tax=Ornithorhynchus anatinus TaxID=9258 RepID=A0A6I8NCT0_ORNAN